MPEILPHSIHLDQHNDYMAIRLAQAYRPHTPIPTRLELMENRYQLDGHLSLKGLCEQMGVDYKQEIKRRR